MIGLIVTVPVIVAAAMFWGFYVQEFDYEYLLNNGVELEATVVGYDYHSASHGIDGDPTDTSSGWYYIWECYYDGKRYWGTAPNGYIRTEAEVIEYLGTTFTVTVDPNSNWVIPKPLSAIRESGFHYTEYLTCAIVFTCLSPFVLIAFIGLIVYPTILNGKIDRCGKLPVQGEVIKVKGWLFKFVKVRYENKGITKEKWSYDWCTHREAKFLQQKKIINLVPYKNTCGILEEMPAVKTQIFYSNSGL